MITCKEEDDFMRLANLIPKETVEDWINELHGWKVENLRFWNYQKDIEVVKDSTTIVEAVNWIAEETHMCYLDYRDPPAWFVYRVLTYKK
jgi:hypothetical protein